MKVYIGRIIGVMAKRIIAILEKLGHKVVDLGTYSETQPCDYPDVAKELGTQVAADRDSRGICCQASVDVAATS
jgi:ribose 5-phosphate isomerase RpiB